MEAGTSEGPATSPTAEDKEFVSDFHGVYLLVSLNPRMRGRTYIGFTVDPERRLRQHNRGKDFGGACRTSNRGPWAMVLVVHGFPNAISALRFEWAWQHPGVSRRLAAVPRKRSAERMFEYNFRVLGEMLNVGPWSRLPLTVRWLRPDVRFAEFPPERRPPAHMPIVTGPVTSVMPKAERKAAKERQAATQAQLEDGLICSICIGAVALRDQIQCLSDRCRAISHLICLASHFRESSSGGAGDGPILPIQGRCPVCDEELLWGALIKKRKATLGVTASDEAAEADVRDLIEDDGVDDENEVSDDCQE